MTDRPSWREDEGYSAWLDVRDEANHKRGPYDAEIGDEEAEENPPQVRGAVARISAGERHDEEPRGPQSACQRFSL